MIYDMIIVGGGPAGLTAALYGRRANKSVLIIEKNAFGGQMNNSPKIENYPAFDSISGAQLSDKMLDCVLSKGAEVELDEVQEIIDGDIKTVKTNYGEYKAKTVIVACGVKHRQLSLEREDAFVGRGVYYCAVCDGGYFKDKDVILVGGGNSALQEAIMLADICRKVTVVQNLSSFTGEAKLVNIVSGLSNVDVYFNCICKNIIGSSSFEGITIENTLNKTETVLKAEGLFVAIGLSPDNKRFGNIALLDSYGYFDSDEKCLTSNSGIFVAGDCRKKDTRQIVTAVSDGATAALAACKYIDM